MTLALRQNAVSMRIALLFHLKTNLLSTFCSNLEHLIPLLFNATRVPFKFRKTPVFKLGLKVRELPTRYSSEHLS